MNQEIFEQVRDIVADLLDIDPEMITPESKFQADLGADSLDLVELIMEFEEQLGGEISDEDAQKITTVGEAVDFMEDLMKSEEEEAVEEVTTEAEPEEAEEEWEGLRKHLVRVREYLGGGEVMVSN